MQTIANDLAKNEAKYTAEKERMKELIEQLQSDSNEHIKRIEELEAVKQQQEIVIKSQTEQLNSKVRRMTIIQVIFYYIINVFYLTGKRILKTYCCKC